MSSSKAHPLYKRISCLALILTLLISILPAGATAAATGVTNAKVVLRKAADKDSKALQTLPKGEEVSILSSSGSWYRVRYGSFTGYLMKKYVTSKAGSTQSIADLGSAPGIMRPGDENADVKKLQQALKMLGYYDGSIDGKYGSGTTKAVKAYQKDKKLEADGYAGERTVTAIFGSCRSTSLTTQKAPGEGSSNPSGSKYATVSSIAEIGSAPSACREGDSGSNVVKIQQALECLGYYSGTIDGVYGEGTVAAVKRFQTKRGMTADGIAGPATIRVIFGSYKESSTSKTYKTETPDWFKDNMTRVIPKNARFTIKDVATGKTFEAVRWSGVNHLDAEPRTASDAKITKEIYGGSWSWRRRPILVMYNGHVYAASMNGMPHGTDTISGNSFEGHFCIHFLNSRTHESNKVDSEHQNAVQKASKATW